MAFTLTSHEKCAQESGFQHLIDSPSFHIFTSLLWHFGPSNAAHIVPSRSSNHLKYPNDLLPYHQDRLVASARCLDWVDVVSRFEGGSGLELLQSAIARYATVAGNRSSNGEIDGLLKIVIKINNQGTIAVSSTPIDVSPPSNSVRFTYVIPANFSDSQVYDLSTLCKVYLSPIYSYPSLFTRHKTDRREGYDEARKSLSIEHLAPNVAEVLLYNERGEIMEASLSTPYFFRKCTNRDSGTYGQWQWVTPPVSNGGNAGVSRRLALEHGLCLEQMVEMNSLKHGEVIWVSNAVRGFTRGILRLRTPLGCQLETSAEAEKGFAK